MFQRGQVRNSVRVGVYAQDIAEVAAYRERGLDYTALCQPHWVHTDAATFYGFWGACFNAYRTASPHEGYATVRVRAYTAWRPLAACLAASLTGAKYGGGVTATAMAGAAVFARRRGGGGGQRRVGGGASAQGCG
jgi:hypothetical protein